MSRRLNSLPSTQEQLTPHVIDPDKVVEVMKKKQEMSKEHYDHGIRQLSVLKPGDAVRIQMQGRWIPGVVIRQAEAPHLYVVRGPRGHECNILCSTMSTGEIVSISGKLPNRFLC